MKTRYPIKVKGVVFPPGTELERATVEEAKAHGWANIELNKDSNQVAVWFPNIPWITIVDKNQVAE